MVPAFRARQQPANIFHQKEANMADKPTLVKPIEDVTPIAKPDTAFSLDKFKSKHAAAVANVETLQTGLPHHSIAQAKDFVRLHPNEEFYWSPELCFVNVPIKGQKKDTLHLIDEELAMRYLPSGKILRFRLVLATKPYDVFFLCHLSKAFWVQATSRKEEGVEGYKIDVARDHDAFPEPKWPTQSLAELIEKTFVGRMIDREDHPALLRLIGAKQVLE
jgi:hypothetical protein